MAELWWMEQAMSIHFLEAGCLRCILTTVDAVSLDRPTARELEAHFDGQCIRTSQGLSRHEPERLQSLAQCGVRKGNDRVAPMLEALHNPLGKGSAVDRTSTINSTTPADGSARGTSDTRPDSRRDTSMLARRCLGIALLLAVAASGCRPATPSAVPVQPAEQAIRVSGSGAALPLVRKLAEAYSRERPSAQFEIDAGTNSGGGISGVIQGTLDMSVTNRPLTEAESKESLLVHPFARDAVVFAAHTSSPLQDLSTSEVRAVYGATLTNWAQFKGSSGPIVVLDRDPEEPQRSLFLLKVLDGQPVQARTTVLTSAPDMLRTLEATSDSVGYSTLSLLRILQPKDVRVLRLDGVTPGRDSLTAGTYPWYLTYGLVSRPDGPATIDRFLEFVRGPGGQRVLDTYDAATANA